MATERQPGEKRKRITLPVNSAGRLGILTPRVGFKKGSGAHLDKLAGDTFKRRSGEVAREVRGEFSGRSTTRGVAALNRKAHRSK